MEGDGPAAFGFGVDGFEPHRAASEIDAAPFEAHEFLGAHAGVKGEGEVVGQGGGRGGEESGGFIAGEPADAALRFLDFDGADGVGIVGPVATVIFGDGGAEQGKLTLDAAVLKPLGAALVEVGVDVSGGEAGRALGAEVGVQGAGNGAGAGGVAAFAGEVFGKDGV